MCPFSKIAKNTVAGVRPVQIIAGVMPVRIMAGVWPLASQDQGGCAASPRLKKQTLIKPVTRRG